MNFNSPRQFWWMRRDNTICNCNIATVCKNQYWRGLRKLSFVFLVDAPESICFFFNFREVVCVKIFINDNVIT